MQNETGLLPAVQAAKRKLRSSRGRRIGSPTPTVSSDADELSDCSLMSAASTQSAATSVGARKRALPTKGSDDERPKKKSVKPQAGRDDDFAVPLAPVAKTRAKASLPSAEELSRELTDQPTGDLGSHIIENLEIIEKVADKSRNLKGDMVRAIRLAVRHVQAAATEVVQRATTAHLEKENATLRSQLADLHGKVEALTAELNELRRENTAVRPEPPHAEKRRVDNGDALMDRIGSIIDKKLASFRNELFPDRAIRPPLGQKITPVTPARPPVAQAPLRHTVASSSAAQAETWVTVVGRKARAKERSPPPTRVEPARRQSPSCGRRKTASQRRPVIKAVPAPVTQRPKKGRAGRRKAAKQKLPRVPKSAAVTVTVPEGSNITYGEVMKTAKGQIKLEDLGIAEVRQKKALNGGLLIEIAGEDCAVKADALAGKLQAVVADMGVKVARPSKQGEARVMDLDDSVTQEEVAEAIAAACGCIASDVKVGQIRRRPSALGTAWVRCPLTAIRKLAAAKRLLVGWVSTRVEVLPARSLQCFRCLETGHARNQCTSTKDRSALCYVCGEPGHRASQCGAQAPKCALCADFGRPADHRIGSKRCTPPKRWKRGNGGDETAGTAASSGNLNHCRGAQDLLQQCLVDCSVSLAVMAEPYRVPEHPRWVGDDAQSVAVYLDPPCSRLHSERGIVAVEWGPLVVLGCYVSPNCTLGAFETFLDRVANCVRSCLPRPVLVMGDFNAHSRVWGNRRDSPRGEAMLEWAAGLDLRLLNRGSVSTCVRWQGESVVDLSWATLSAERLITGWRVADELVTLSDHRHILVDVVLRLPAVDARRAEDRPCRWALKRLNRDLLVAAAHVVDWSSTAGGDDRLDPEREAIKLRDDMTAICDTAMPRVSPGWRRPVYWWSEHIARLRAACLRARRQYTRARRRRSSGAAEWEEKYVEYRAATTLLQSAIAER
ncbi:uncharacterized protein [Epargyreus clarus]|uniref:uncharacterized protein n=1 Tax=Epargyreus clarus TaxID=520877 RepID=UPI003C2D1FE8